MGIEMGTENGKNITLLKMPKFWTTETLNHSLILMHTEIDLNHKVEHIFLGIDFKKLQRMLKGKKAQYEEMKERSGEDRDKAQIWELSDRKFKITMINR